MHAKTSPAPNRWLFIGLVIIMGLATATALAQTTTSDRTVSSETKVNASSSPTKPSDTLGLYPSADFTISVKGSPVKPALRQAAWYFRDDVIGVPRAGLPVAGYETSVHAFTDLKHWTATRADTAVIDYPPFVWLAAPQHIRHAKLTDNARSVVTPSATLPFQIVPKLPLNQSYANASSIAFFSSREVSLRGTTGTNSFVARTIWPEDFQLGPNAPILRNLPSTPPQEALRKLMQEFPRGTTNQPYSAVTLWQRPGTSSNLAGRPIIGIMVNGAQGDDDEAHGGHFAIVTGRIQQDGYIGNWLVNNFYSLDVESEKGIIAAVAPLDNYMGDLNAGQGWYRPTTMLVVVLENDQAVALAQSAINRVFNQFYRHQLTYFHPNQNCASISIDTLRAIGWHVPRRGPTSRTLAWLAYPIVAIKDLSIAKGKLAFDYLRTDQTRLLPAAALEETFASLLGMTQASSSRRDGKLEALMKRDMQALAFINFPQFPSSRAFGGPPAASTWDYRTLVPSDPTMMKIIPVPPRPFPPELRDPDLLSSPWTPADYATLSWGILVFVILPLLLLRWRKRRQARSPA